MPRDLRVTIPKTPAHNKLYKVKNLVSLQTDEIKALTSLGIFTEDDLSYTKFEDLPQSINVVKRRKLSLIGTYLAVESKALSEKSTMKKIQSALNPKDKTPRVTAAPTSGGQATSKSSALKISTHPLPSFSGDAWDFEKWQKGVRATLGQASTYKKFMTSPPDQADRNEIDRDEEFFHMIMSSVGVSHAQNVVEKSELDNGESGHSLWKAMEKWYMDPSRIDAIIDYWDTKLGSLRLDIDTSATEFINNFEIIVRNIEKHEGPWSDFKKVREFKRRVVDDGYETEIRTCKAGYDELIETVRKREQDLLKETLGNGKVTRRFKAEENISHQGGGEHMPTASSKIPYLPTCLMQALDSTARANIIKWRSLSNSGRKMSSSDLVKLAAPEKEAPTEKEKTKKDRTKKKPSTKGGKASDGCPPWLKLVFQMARLKLDLTIVTNFFTYRLLIIIASFPVMIVISAIKHQVFCRIRLA